MLSRAVNRFLSGVAIAAVGASVLVAGVGTITAPPAQAAQDPATCPAPVALTNSSFEQPVVTGPTGVQFYTDTDVPGWTTSASDHQIELWGYPNPAAVRAAAGKQFAELNANQPSTLFQEVDTVPGQSLQWSLKHRGRDGNDTMRVLIGPPGGTLVQSGPDITDGKTAWGTHTGTYVVPAGQTRTQFAFRAVSTSSGSPSVGNFLDDIYFGTGPCLISDKSVVNVTDPGQPAEVGDVLEYTVKTTNNGGNPALVSASTDQLPTTLDYVPGSMQVVSGPGVGALTDAADTDRGEYVGASRIVRVRLGDNATGTVGGSIGPGVTTGYSFRAKVNVTGAAKTITNVASVTFTDSLSNIPRTSTTPDVPTNVRPAADLAVAKTIETTPLVAGAPIEYRLRVTNKGPQTGTGVTVSDVVPAGLSDVTATVPGGSCTVAATVTCTLPDVTVGAVVDVTLKAKIAAGMNPGAGISNTATVRGNETDTDVSNNSSTVSGTVTASADVVAVKRLVTTTPVAGQNVVYEVVVRNDGPSQARNVVLSDPIDPKTSFVKATIGAQACQLSAAVVTCPVGVLEPGASATATIEVTLAPNAVAAVQNTATVRSETPDPKPENNVSNVTYNPNVVADLAVTKAASTGEVTAGTDVSFTLTARNNGPSDATNVLLTDQLPQGLTVQSIEAPAGATCADANGAVSCTWTSLPAGAQRVVVVHTTVAVDAPAGTLTNTASIASPAKDPDTTNNTDSVDVTVVPRADLRVTKTASPVAGIAGESQSYTMTVTNAGPSTSRGVTLHDALPAEIIDASSSTAGCSVTGGVLDCQLGDLAPNTSKAVVVTGTWNPATTGTIKNSVTVNAATEDTDRTNNTASVDVPVTAQANVSVAKTTTQTSVPRGGTITYQVTVRNAGPSVADAVLVKESPGTGLTITNATPSVGSWDAASGQWLVGRVQPGATATLTVTAKADAEGVLRNAVSATSPTKDPDPRDNTSTVDVPVTPVADISVTKDVAPGTLTSNGLATFTMTVRNAGPSTAQNVVLRDTIPAGLVVPATTDARCSIVNGDFVCTAASLANAASTTFVFTARVDPGTAATSLTNTAKVSADTNDPDPGNNTDDVTAPIAASPAIVVTKTGTAPIDKNGNDRIDAGDTIAYSFEARNTGNTTLTNIVVNDPLLGGAVQCAGFPASLAPGAVATCGPVTYSLKQRDLDAGTVHNVATASADSPRGKVTSPESPLDTTVPSVSSISLAKSVGAWQDVNNDGRVGPGDVLEYTFVARNTGTTTLEKATITDPMLGGEVPCPALNTTVLVPGLGVECGGGKYTVRQSDVDNGLVENTATITATSPTGQVKNTATARTTVTGTDAVELVKTAGAVVDTTRDGRVGAGDTIPYTFTIKNVGTTTLSALSLSDPLLGSAVTCAALEGARLAPGDALTCGPVQYVLTQDDVEAQGVSNTATVRGRGANGPVTDGSTAELELHGTAGIALEKTAGDPIDTNGDDRIGAGDAVDYTFTVRNTGTVTLRDVVVTDARLGGTVACAELEGAVLRPGDSVTCAPVRASLTQQEIDASLIHNEATVRGESKEGRATGDASVDVALAGVDEVKLVKSADAIVDANGNGRQDAGDTLRYSFAVTNTGTTTLSKVEIADPRITSAITCDLTELAPGETALCTAEPVTLTQAEADAGKIVNSAVASATGVGDKPVTSTDTITTVIEGQAAVALQKRAGAVVDANGDGRPSAGDTIAYSFTVRNTGTVTLTDIAIDDALLGGRVTCGVSELAPGATAECGPYTYTITAADVRAKQVRNVATVSATGGGQHVTGSDSVTVEIRTLAVTGSSALILPWVIAALAMLGGVLLISRRRRQDAVE